MTDAPAEATALHAMAKLGLEQYDQDRLKVGAAGELLAAGIVAEVRPLEDAELLAAADPRRTDGTAAFNEVGQWQRDQAIVKRLLQCTESVAIVILGGSHDLTSELSASDRPVRYLMVGVRAYEAAGQD